MPRAFDGIIQDPLAADPSSPVDGETWMRTTAPRVKARLNSVSVGIVGPDFSGKVFTVHATDPRADHTTIQAAVDAVGNGDVILIAPGDYPEQVHVDGKSISLIGMGGLLTGTGDIGIVNINPTLTSDGEIGFEVSGTVELYVEGIVVAPNVTAAGTYHGINIGSSSGMRVFVNCGVRIAAGAGGTGDIVGVHCFSSSSAGTHFWNCHIRPADGVAQATTVLHVEVIGGNIDFHGCHFQLSGGGVSFGDVEVSGTGDLRLHRTRVDGDLIRNGGGTITVDGGTSWGGLSGFVDDDTETNLIKNEGGLLRTDGQNDLSKLALRELAADPGTLTDGMVWARTTAPHVKARLSGATVGILGPDFTGKVHTVHATDPRADFTTIQAAHDDSDTVGGDRILIGPGSYPEQFQVTKSVSFHGSGSNRSGTTLSNNQFTVMDPAITTAGSVLERTPSAIVVEIHNMRFAPVWTGSSGFCNALDWSSGGQLILEDVVVRITTDTGAGGTIRAVDVVGDSNFHNCHFTVVDSADLLAAGNKVSLFIHGTSPVMNLDMCKVLNGTNAPGDIEMFGTGSIINCRALTVEGTFDNGSGATINIDSSCSFNARIGAFVDRVTAFSVAAWPFAGTVITVGAAGADHTTIQAALNAMDVDDIVLCEPGNYPEELTLQVNGTLYSFGGVTINPTITADVTPAVGKLAAVTEFTFHNIDIKPIVNNATGAGTTNAVEQTQAGLLRFINSDVIPETGGSASSNLTLRALRLTNGSVEIYGSDFGIEDAGNDISAGTKIPIFFTSAENITLDGGSRIIDGSNANGDAIINNSALTLRLGECEIEGTLTITDAATATRTGATAIGTLTDSNNLLINISPKSRNDSGIKQPVRLATTAALAANTAAGSGEGKTLTADANGSLSVDSVGTAVNDRILVKDEATGADRGIYTVTQVGSGGSPYILTRAVDFDNGDNGDGIVEVESNVLVTVQEGTDNVGKVFRLSTTGVIVIDTTSLTFIQFGGILVVRGQKSITIENPTTALDAPMFRVDRAVTITEMVIVTVGAGAPSVTVDVRHGTDRSAAGNALITTPTASTEAANNAESTGHVITSFDDATIPTDSFIWIEIDAVTGLASAEESVSINLFYDED